MKFIKTLAASLVAAFSFAAAMAVIATPASAQATRTWVSGVGDDVNPCSRTAPCKTFAGAISKTAAGGIINCLDPAGYGALTITKSITIDCEDTQGASLASGTNGFTVNDSLTGFPNTIRVILRGLSIEGNGSTGAQNASGNLGTGLVGVNFVSGASVTIEDCIIQNFNAGNASGVRVSVTGTAVLRIINSHIVNNSISGTGGGVFITPSGAGATVRAEITNSQIVGNTNAGVRVDTTSTNGNGVNLSIDNTLVSGGANGVLINQPIGSAQITVMISDSVVANNTSFGLRASGPGAGIRFGSTTLFNNGTNQLGSSGAAINSFGDNQVENVPLS